VHLFTSRPDLNRVSAKISTVSLAITAKSHSQIKVPCVSGRLATRPIHTRLVIHNKCVTNQANFVSYDRSMAVIRIIRDPKTSFIFLDIPTRLWSFAILFLKSRARISRHDIRNTNRPCQTLAATTTQAQLKPTQSDSTQLNSTQANSIRFNSTQLKPTQSDSTQLSSSQLKPTQLSSLSSSFLHFNLLKTPTFPSQSPNYLSFC
jgi:hypothetical protein